jgi:hypothetical protein
LINNQDTQSFSGIPGFANVPVLGKFLLGSNNTDKTRSNLLIALIPHVVRSPGIDATNLRGVAAGTDQTVKLNYAPKDEPTPAPAPAAATPSVTPAPAPPVPPSSSPAAPSVTPSLSLFPADARIALSAPVSLTLMVQNVNDLNSAPVRIKWDPKILRLNEVKPGTLFTQGGAGSLPTVDIRNDAGEAAIGIIRAKDAPAITGTGAMLLFNFVAVGKGTAKVEVSEATLQNSKSEPIRVAPVSVPVLVQ